MKIFSIGLICVGVAWLLGLGGMYFVMSGISTPAFPDVFWYYGSRAIGPVLLIVGPLLIMSSYRQKLGVILIIVGCVFLTILLASSLFEFLNVKPLQRKPDLGDYTWNAFLAVIGVLADVAAFRLCYLILMK